MVDKRDIFGGILLVLLVSLVSATFNVGNPEASIDTIYGPSEDVTGWVNISFSSEPLSSEFQDSRGNTANLSRLLDRNVGYSYSCDPSDCGIDFSASSPSQQKTRILNAGVSEIYGIKLTGDITSIDSITFDIQSDAAASCENQIEIDFLADGSVDARNTKVASSGSCSNIDYGCFDSGQTLKEYKIESTPYCERVNLSESPGFLLGAWVKKDTGVRNLTAALYTLNGANVAQCYLPDPSGSASEVSCGVDYATTSAGEYYVCIYSISGTGDYWTRGYSDIENGCGFYGTPIKAEKQAYQIFSQGKRFDSVGILTLDHSLENQRGFHELAQDYLIARYGDFDCTNGCVLPIKVTSKVNQIINLKNLNVNYQEKGGIVSEKSFYDVAYAPAKVTSNFQKLYIDEGGFSVPDDLGDYSFILSFNGQEIVSEALEVKDVPIVESITPTSVAAAYSTTFTAKIDSDYNITGYSWSFGDNSSTITTSKNQSIHTYSSSGIYDLRITLTDTRGLSSSKTFSINVSSPKALINSSLKNMGENLDSVKADLASLSRVYQNAINYSLGLSDIESKLSELEAKYNSASTEEEYVEIVTELQQIRIPDSISKTKTGKTPLIPHREYIDIDAIENIAGGSAGSSDEAYVEAVVAWNLDNLDILVDLNEFSGRYDGYTEPIVRTFEMDFDEKLDIPYNYYLILEKPQGFNTDDIFTAESEYVYLNLRDVNGKVSFSSDPGIEFTEIPAFVSPALSRLNIVDGVVEKETPTKYTILILILIILVVGGIITYVVFQEWYRRKYEKHLFPNRNDLYNMAHYINNAKKRGMAHGDMRKNLKKAGWTTERINYAMKKYAGKRTGMLELPLPKAIKKV